MAKLDFPSASDIPHKGFEVATLTRNPEGRVRATCANLQSESQIRGVVAIADIVVSAVRDDAALLDIVFEAGRLKETAARLADIRGNQHCLFERLAQTDRRRDTNKNGARRWEVQRSRFLARGRTALP